MRFAAAVRTLRPPLLSRFGVARLASHDTAVHRRAAPNATGSHPPRTTPSMQRPTGTIAQRGARDRSSRSPGVDGGSRNAGDGPARSRSGSQAGATRASRARARSRPRGPTGSRTPPARRTAGLRPDRRYGGSGSHRSGASPRRACASARRSPPRSPAAPQIARCDRAVRSEQLPMMKPSSRARRSIASVTAPGGSPTSSVPSMSKLMRKSAIE